MTDAEFQRLMEEVDAQLKTEMVAIHARPLHAVRHVSMRLKTEIIIAPAPAPSIAGRYDKLTIGAHINDWFTARYGNRLKIHFGPGAIAILIRGDPWRLTLPRIYGVVTMTCDPDIEKFRHGPKLSTGKERPICNVLNCIKDFPPGLAAQLTTDERRQILGLFTRAMDTLQQLETTKDKPYIIEAFADIEAAVSNIFSNPPQYGLSKWASLQVAEKVMKSYLHLKKAKIPKHHDLLDIAYRAQLNGLPPISVPLLDRIQCTPGVRYGEVGVNLEEAISAHSGSLEVCRIVAPYLR